MKKMNSLMYRITGLTFLLLTVTVLSLIYLANWQMEALFREYLSMQGAASDLIVMNPMGTPELDFLHSVHESLLWVGMVFALLGFFASYILARNITVPLRALRQAAELIRGGELGRTVRVQSKDEVGELANIFNQMSAGLAQNERLRRELLANIAHELRTPLTILNGNLESMLDGVIKPDPTRLFSMQEEVLRLTRLVTDLRDLSLAEVRQLELHKKAVTINPLIERAADMLLPLLEEKELLFSYELADNLPMIKLDEDRILQVLYNIIVNAVRYTDAGTQIVLHSEFLLSETGKNELKVQIRDFGPGILPEDMPYIFDHFYRGEKSRNRQSGGSGIGLALAKQLVKSHGGEIMAENMEPRGMQITIFLPYLDE
ncbi:MAG: sensor histidine kinase [Selenomonadaceae bacterium]